MGNVYSMFFPPPPALTEANLPSQEGKVFIVTGGYSGVGYELSSILYRAGGTVYVAGRNEEKAITAIAEIKELSRSTPGKLFFLDVVLDNLSTIKPAVERFMQHETRLDVLFNNAGVSATPSGTLSSQGHELQLATNCLAPYLLTKLLSPVLLSTAKSTPPAAVRVVFTSSIVTDLSAPTGGLDLSHLAAPPPNQQTNYATSKTANWFLASHFSDQLGPHGVLSVVQNPGNLKTALLRHMPWIVGSIVSPLLYHARFGAFTELWSGLSLNLVIEDGGRCIQPWGRFHPNPRADILASLKSKEDGGTGLAAQVVEYCDKVTTEFQ